MRPSLIVLALTTLVAGTAARVPGAAAQGYYGSQYSSGYRGEAPRARVWLDDNRDFYRRGERLRILFSTSEDAYVAVIHIDAPRSARSAERADRSPSISSARRCSIPTRRSVSR